MTRLVLALVATCLVAAGAPAAPAAAAAPGQLALVGKIKCGPGVVSNNGAS